MIKGFVKKELAVKDCCTYTAIRDVEGDEHPDVIEYFNVTKNPTDPAMQQVNVSRSKLNVIRGIHISAFTKVVFCPMGRIFDVVVDMRPDSPTFKKWCGAWLDRDTHIVCPPFCAHGVFAGEEDSAICYYQGGTFFPHLDYAISGLDKSLEIEWPHPIDAENFVMSEKDLGSKCADEELWATIKARMDDPIKDMHTVTNSDIVVISDHIESGVPIARKLVGTRLHLLQQNANNRESLRAALVSLRPKEGVIYVVNSGKRDVTTSSLTEMMNIIHVCDELKHQLVIVCEEETPESKIIADLIAKEKKDEVAILVGQCVLYNGMDKKEIVQKIQSTVFAVPSFTDLDELADGAIQLLKNKKGGNYLFVNPGKLDAAAVTAFLKENGADFDVRIEGAEVAENEANKGTQAAAAFAKLIA